MDLIPAKLKYLCIFNPSLGQTQEELPRQILYYHGDAPTTDNERLRQVGLAQGLVEFARELSDGGKLRFVDSTKTRSVVVNLVDNYWITVCVHMPVEVRNGAVSEYNLKGMSSSDIMEGELLGAFSRWQLFSGGFDALKDSNSDEFAGPIKESLKPYWDAFCSCWNPNMHTRGILGAFPYTETERIHLSEDTIQVVEAVLSKDVDLVHCSVARSGTPSKVVYASKSNPELASWLLECCDIEDIAAFIEKSGFVSHVSIRKARSLLEEKTPEVEESSYMSKLGNMTTATVNTLSKMPWTPWKATLPNDVEDIAPEDDVEDGKFLLGLNSDGELVERHVHTKDGTNTLVVYQRAPLTFALLYKTTPDKNVFPTLHLKLASLVEPIVRDIEGGGLSNSHYTKLQHSQDPFCFIAADPRKQTLTTNLRPIPFEIHNFLNPQQNHHAEMTHVHTQMSRLLSQQETFFGHEKLARSDKNWWFYWTKLPDGRQVYMARKWVKSKPSADGHGIVNAMGRSAKLWLDVYVKQGYT